MSFKSSRQDIYKLLRASSCTQVHTCETGWPWAFSFSFLCHIKTVENEWVALTCLWILGFARATLRRRFLQQWWNKKKRDRTTSISHILSFFGFDADRKISMICFVHSSAHLCNWMTSGLKLFIPLSHQNCGKQVNEPSAAFGFLVLLAPLSEGGSCSSGGIKKKGTALQV